MMPRDMVAFTASSRGPVHHICKRSVMFHKIKVCSGEIIHLIAQVSSQRQRLSKRLQAVALQTPHLSKHHPATLLFQNKKHENPDGMSHRYLHLMLKG